MLETASATVNPSSILGRDKPRHHFFSEETQFRVKLQGFSRLPSEVTVQKIEFGRDQARYLAAAQKGLANVSTHRRRPDPDDTPSAEALERSQFRAKREVRLRVTELAPTALVTFTTRAVLTLDQLLWVWQYFNRLLRQAGADFEYVAVPERHPTNPDHLHLHAAVRGSVHYKTLRRLWHIALEAREGRRVERTLYGKEAPGNIDVQPAKASGLVKRVRKIAKYLSKYLTKDLIAEFNRRRYWPSKGIKLQEPQVFWLDSLTQGGAIVEACELLALSGGGRAFIPSDRVAYWVLDPSPDPVP